MLPDADSDPDSHPPTNLFQRFMNLLHLFLQWTKTAEALVRPTLPKPLEIGDINVITSSSSSDMCSLVFYFGFPQYSQILLVCDVQCVSCSCTNGLQISITSTRASGELRQLV